MTAVSQWEREAIGERTATALQYKRANNKVFNHVPYGFMRDGDNLVPLPEEHAVINRARMLRANGWTLRRIADTFNAENIPTKNGGIWQAQTIKNVVESPTYQAA
jgi:site-specific DNA recombinase